MPTVMKQATLGCAAAALRAPDGRGIRMAVAPIGRFKRLAHSLLLGVGCVGGCGPADSSTAPLPPAPGTPTVASVSLDKPELMFVHVGLRDTLRAIARNQAGIEMTDVQFTWTSSDAGVVTVDAAGVVTSLGPGTAQVSASAAGRRAAVPATVQITSSDFTLCSGGLPTVVLLVEAQLRASLAADVARFADDLCVDGYGVWMAEFVPPNPSAIRAYLADAWTRSERTLQGAMLIGRIPHAYQYVVAPSTNPAFPDVREEVISFQYYADVNGDFTVSPGYNGAHPYSYDEHGGDMNWELWIGVLPVYKGSTPATIDALQRYFAKNHT